MSEVAGGPDLSVVTPTHNRPASLLRLLRGLRDGSFPPERFEVVVVADGCSDDTVTVARAEPLPFAVRVLEQTPGRGAATARNLGAAHAAGRLLVFLDDDIEPGPALLAEHHRAHAGVGEPAVAIGPPLPVRPAEADLDTIAAWDWWEGQFARMRQPGHRFSYDEVFGANLSVPAALFRSVGGFDVELLCREDGELGLRLIRAGARVLFLPAAGGWHHELRDLQRLVRRKRAEGIADVGLARRHPELWPGLRLSWGELPLWHPLGLLRRSALSAPRVAGFLTSGLASLLPALERLHLRGTWRKVQAGVMYGTYWRGVADAVGGRAGLAALARACHERMPPPAPAPTIDLAEGLVAAERAIEAARPAAAWIRFGLLEVGFIPARPGAERLRAGHLRAELGTVLPHELIAVLSSAALVGHPAAPRLQAHRPPPVAAGPPPVSVIMAAHDAAGTIAEALASLGQQAHPAWEAIVVDDGSTDETAEIVERLAARDPRIRLIRQARQGPGAARNAGLTVALHPWVLFLDADDWLLPHALERLGQEAAGGKVDAVHGAWARVSSRGVVMATEFGPPQADLFPAFAEHCAFPIHACLFRRELAARVGGFDPALETCEDWDLWQRMARSGARFTRLTEKVAHYRMLPHSASTATDRLMRDALTVIARGHDRDPRVPAPRHAEGAPSAGLPAARLRFAPWVAGLLIGRGRPAGWVLEALQGDAAAELNPAYVAADLFRAVPCSHARGVDVWDELWPAVVDQLTAFLDACERQSGCWRLARRTMLALEQLTLEASRQGRPFVRGNTLAAAVEVTAPIETITAPAGVERLHCDVLVRGARIGSVLLPVIDGAVTARVLADAIAAAHAWPILGAFFAATRYAELQVARTPDGLSVLLDGMPLVAATPDAAVVAPGALHDLVGWTVLLQEVWGAPGVPADDFYAGHGAADPGASVPVDLPDHPVVEISAELPGFRFEGTALVEVRAGGVPMGLLPIESHEGLIAPARLRAAITTQAGLELCRVVVREAILGQAFDGGRIRPRLAALAGRPRPDSVGTRFECIPGPDRLVPDWQGVAVAVAGGGPGLFMARHAPMTMNLPSDRRASLPSALTPELEAAAEAIGPPVVRILGVDGQPGRVEYLPELLWRRAAGPDGGTAGSPGSSDAPGRQHDRHHFEALFAAGADPWSYETPYEQLKYRQTLSLLPAGQVNRALELACAEGRFTRLLAPRVGELIAADFSRIALQRAAAACPAPNVRFELLDLVRDALPDQCDLIVCSEVLYFLEDLATLRAVGEKLAAALAPGGHLLMAHANLQVDDPGLSGFDWDLPYGARVIGETLAAISSLQPVRELRTDAYRVQLFRRRAPGAADDPPPVVEHATHEPPAPRVAARFKTGPGRRAESSSAGTGRATLPVLMYHSVASEGPAATARYRVRPEQFDAQLRYLKEAGFSSVTAGQWLAAARIRRPLPSRSVLLTFDDGYLDFHDTAWPILQRHGFSALVFLVTGRVGGTNAWDAAHGAPVRLMDWDQVRRLALAGVEFGAHSTSHRPLTGLEPGEIVRDTLACRQALSLELGRTVTAYAYPYGDTDPVIEHLVGASGFQAGFTARSAHARFADLPLALPRIEIAGDDDLAAFITKLGD